MLALSPPLFSNMYTMRGSLEDQNNNFLLRDMIEDIGSEHSSSPLLFLNFPTPPVPSDHYQFEIDPSTTPSTATINSDLRMVKKLNHNASERDRRKKINDLYSSLRALLPVSDQTKKLSIPATVSRVVKYVPLLQEEMEELVRKREELLSRINSRQQGNTNTFQKVDKIKYTAPNSLSSISATQLNEKEIAVQISTYKLNNNNNKQLSQMLHNFQSDGFSLLHASSFESSRGRVFHNLHLQVVVDS
ncbi:transcription factor ORG3-like [Humulus lupulus]|uniref:transcription factor ORG3-like n=1 Tax=Humulus lupulus TaxID=3486 RepID=UPI002B416E8C|nr:transcription factor ORG3-like [Humulus lupulus]XP_062110164.1 transcription factor ORG3-like [Humulus lupulus]